MANSRVVNSVTKDLHILLFSERISIFASILLALKNLGQSMNVKHLVFIRIGSTSSEPIRFISIQKQSQKERDKNQVKAHKLSRATNNIPKNKFVNRL